MELVWNAELKRHITPREQEFMLGTSGLSPAKEEKYRRLLRGQPVQGSKRAGKSKPPPTILPCMHRGVQIRESIPCAPCGKGKGLFPFVCALYGKCTPVTEVAGIKCCATCDDCTTAIPPDLLPGLPDPRPVMEAVAIPDGWEERSSVQERHVAALNKLVGSTIPTPAKAEGDGIVYVGGGKYWPMLVVALRMTRDVCDLPIQVWYRGKDEPVDQADIADIPGVTLIDATTYPTRKQGGWETKSLALLHCGFERVLYLDADAYLVSDPVTLFDLLEQHPFVFWEDIEHHEGDVKWEMVGLDGRNVPCVQGGQLAINRKTFWRELVISYWLNQHADFYYRVAYGDQDQYRIVLALTGQRCLSIGRAEWREPAFICRLLGEPIIIHRPHGKGPPFDNRGFGTAMHLPGEAKALRFHERYHGTTATEVFSRIYRSGLWDANGGSGGGSKPEEAAPYLEIANNLIRMAGAEIVVDLGCGDGEITRRLQADQLVGVDCYGKHLNRLRQDCPMVTWTDLDLDTDRDKLPSGDIAFLKDVLHHWPSGLLIDWLTWARTCGKWRSLVVTYDCHEASTGTCPLGGYRPLDADFRPLAGLGLRRLCCYLHKEVAVLAIQDSIPILQ